MTLYELRQLIDGLLSTEAVQARFVPGLELVANLIAPLSSMPTDAEPEDDAEDDAEDDDAEDAEAEDDDAEDAEDDVDDDAEDAEDADDAPDDAAADAPEEADNFRYGWDGRRLTGEPEGQDYLFRRASDGSWYCLRGRQVVWTDDHNSAEVRRGMRAAGATALGISTHAGSTIEIVDAESGVVVRRYAERRRVD